MVEYYLYLDNRRTFACSKYLCGAVFQKPIKVIPPDLEGYIQQLEKEDLAYFYLEEISPHRCNERGYSNTIKLKVEYLLSTMCIKHGYPTRVYVSSSIPHSHHFNCYPLSRNNYCSLIHYAVQSQRDFWMQAHWSKLLPEYDWKSNQGYMSPSHLHALLTSGYSYYHHFKNELIHLPRYWVDYLENRTCLDTHNWLLQPPSWWKREISQPFDFYLDLKRRQILQACLGNYPPPFEETLNKIHDSIQPVRKKISLFD